MALVPKLGADENVEATKTAVAAIPKISHNVLSTIVEFCTIVCKNLDISCGLTIKTSDYPYHLHVCPITPV